ncbi:MAG: SDR family NAD(P)-dependent oxidoreductase [Bacteroidota bacterium]
MKSNRKIALVTGVSREEGIGFGISRELASQGFDVIITARNKSAAEELSKKISTDGNLVIAEGLDITNEKSVSDLAEFVKERFQRLDILINNAGAGFDFGVHPLETEFNVTKDILDINLFGAWRMVKSFYPLLQQSEQSRIVNISSGAGSFGDPIFGLGVHPSVVTSYGISKLALNGLTVKLARQFNEAGDKIKVNSICPGFVATYEGTAEMGARPVSEAVDGILWAATLPDDGPTGGFFRDKEPLSW